MSRCSPERSSRSCAPRRASSCSTARSVAAAIPSSSWRGARVIAIDKDPRAIAAAQARLARYGEAFRAVRADFRDAKNVLAALGIAGVDGALVDLGVSSPQLDEPGRGFSFREPGPLDMRMGEEGETLAELLARVDERELARILRDFGEEPFARPIARAVKRAVAAGEE